MKGSKIKMASDKKTKELRSLDETERLENLYAEDELDETYKPATHLFIPPEAIAYYEEQGFDLRWVSIYDSPNRGALDVKNISKKEQSGYTFVPRDEIPGLSNALTSFFGDKLTAGDHGLYVIGEMALAKISYAKVEARTRYLEEKTKARSRAILEDLKKNSVLPNAIPDGEFRTTRSHPSIASSRKVSLGKTVKTAKSNATGGSEED